MSNRERIVAVVVWLPLVTAVWLSTWRFAGNGGWESFGIMVVVGLVHYRYLLWVIGRWKPKTESPGEKDA